MKWCFQSGKMHYRNLFEKDELRLYFMFDSIS